MAIQDVVDQNNQAQKTTTSTGIVNTAIDTQNPLSQTAGFTAGQYTPNEQTDTVEGRIQKIIAEKSPLMQQAQTEGKQQAGSRGLLNTSMGVQAAQSALYKAATPIASQDAQAQQTAGMFNVGQADKAKQFTAEQQNVAGAQHLSGQQTIQQIQEQGAQQQAQQQTQGEIDLMLQNDTQAFSKWMQNDTQGFQQWLQNDAQAFNKWAQNDEQGFRTWLQNDEQAFNLLIQNDLQSFQKWAQNDEQAFNRWLQNDDQAFGLLLQNDKQRFDTWAQNDQQAFQKWLTNDEQAFGLLLQNDKQKFDQWAQNDEQAFSKWIQNDEQAFGLLLQNDKQKFDQWAQNDEQSFSKWIQNDEQAFSMLAQNDMQKFEQWRQNDSQSFDKWLQNDIQAFNTWAQNDEQSFKTAIQNDAQKFDLIMQDAIAGDDYALKTLLGTQAMQQIESKGDWDTALADINNSAAMQRLIQEGSNTEALAILDGTQKMQLLQEQGDLDLALAEADNIYTLGQEALKGDIQAQLIEANAYWESDLMDQRYSNDADLLTAQTTSQLDILKQEFANDKELQGVINAAETNLQELLNKNNLLIQSSKAGSAYATATLNAFTAVLVDKDMKPEQKQTVLEQLQLEADSGVDFLSSIEGSATPEINDSGNFVADDALATSISGSISNLWGDSYDLSSVTDSPNSVDSNTGTVTGATGLDGLTGSASGKIICTAMNEAYGFGSFRQAIWLKYSKDHMVREHEVGYHAICKPLIKYAYETKGIGHSLVRKSLEFIAKRRTSDIYLEMKGKRRDLIGRAIRSVFEPLCYAVGSILLWMGK